MGNQTSYPFSYETRDNLDDNTILKDFVLGRESYDTTQLVEQTPTGRPGSHCKQLVYDKATKDRKHSGTLVVSRYSLLPCEKIFPSHSLDCEVRQDVYDYLTVFQDENTVEWHINFADPRLFTAFSSGLFAQDEMQVAEMPSLGHLKRALDNSTDPNQNNLIPLTREGGKATPFLIRGIERLCQVATDANPNEGRPAGLYGNNFARASDDVILKATSIIDPSQIVNLIAMAALPGGRGTYSVDEILDTFSTAYTSFRAAKVESQLKINGETSTSGKQSKVVIHTGNWGTGAFGGSKPLMALIQLAAAKMAKIDKVVYHTFNREGTAGYQEGLKMFNKIFASEKVTFEQFVQEAESCKFRWGFSDGN